MNVLLIAGGWSSEREVSLRGAEGIAKALKALGHDVTFFDLGESGDSGLGFDHLLSTAKAHDFAFINLHGAPGEDGLVQAMLERAGCPYQGSGPAASFLSLHKAATKQVLHNVGMLTPEWLFLPKPVQCLETYLDKCVDRVHQKGMAYPLFVKSNDGGSSLLLSRADHEDALREALTSIFQAGCEALVEPCINGIEVTCGVLGDMALPPILIRPMTGTFFDYHHKYTAGATQELCPAPINKALTAHIQSLALQAHTVLGLSGYSRTDFIVRGDVECEEYGEQTALPECFFLEVNTLPGMTETSLVPQEAAAMGLSFPELIAQLMELGLQKHEAKLHG